MPFHPGEFQGTTRQYSRHLLQRAHMMLRIFKTCILFSCISVVTRWMCAESHFLQNLNLGVYFPTKTTTNTNSY